MGTFVGGLGIMLLGLGLYQFSKLFDVYSTPPENENATPWAYWILRGAGFFLLGTGLVVVIIALK